MRATRSPFLAAISAAAGVGALGSTASALPPIGVGGSVYNNDNGTPNVMPAQIDGLKVTQRVGEKLPLDLKFIDSTGAEKTLGAWFNAGKPVLMVMAYARCPLQCPLTLERMTHRLRELDGLAIGKDFNVVVVSFDPTETAEQSAAQKREYVLKYGHADDKMVEGGWAFLTSPVPGRAQALADALGFPYRYLPASNEYAHPTVYYTLTADGRISRYLSGLDTTSREMKLALMDASEGKIGSVADTFWHMCFRFDPGAGGYTMDAFRLMQVGAVVCSVAVGGLITTMVVVERRRRLGRADATGGGTAGPGAAAYPASHEGLA